MHKMFLVEKGQFVVVRNDAGVEVSFSSFAEFNTYYPTLDLTGKDYLDYEPDAGIYIDSEDPSKGIGDAPVQEYEDVIAQAETLLANFNDSYFGKDLKACKALKLEEVWGKANQTIEVKWPLWRQINLNNGLYSPEEKVAKDADIETVINASNVLESQVQTCTTIDEVKAITVTYTPL